MHIGPPHTARTTGVVYTEMHTIKGNHRTSLGCLGLGQLLRTDHMHQQTHRRGRTRIVHPQVLWLEHIPTLPVLPKPSEIRHRVDVQLGLVVDGHHLRTDGPRRPRVVVGRVDAGALGVDPTEVGSVVFRPRFGDVGFGRKFYHF